jgi:hypothetical protein
MLGHPPARHRNRSPPCAGNGVLLRRDRPAKAGSSPSRDKSRDAPEVRKLRHPRTNCEIACEGPNPKTGWWCAQSGANRSPPQIPATREFWANIAKFSTSNGRVNPTKHAGKRGLYEISCPKVAGKICRESGKHFTISREEPRRPATLVPRCGIRHGRPTILTIPGRVAE